MCLPFLRKSISHFANFSYSWNTLGQSSSVIAYGKLGSDTTGSTDI